MANALAAETSPYLRQHAHNPVDWLPWGEQAFARARAQQKPLLVSIGYSACHWCHVMEHESFEDPRTAALMNERFVCVKVDREERPDVDALYMEAVQGMTGHGGWPLNVFLTPEQLPFYGGTYFPPSERAGMPSWTQVLNAVAESWSENSEQIRAGGERIRERLAGAAALRPSRARPDEAPLDEAVAALARSYDARHGGFGGAPKFPQASVIEFLLARGERPMALGTLHAMAAGGIHDQLGGGFARYSVDASWTVPHFEKMLYDNALLARAYLHGYQASGEERLREVCAQVLDWALREMRAPEGGFYSALDADSDGREGAFYVWTVEEIGDVLGEDAPAAIAWLGASERGNFSDPHHPRPGLNVLSDRGPRPPARLRESIRARLLAARGLRPRPALDDKRVTSWNALMIAALADAGTTLGAEPAGAEHGGADPTGAEHGGADPTGAEHGGADPTGAEHDSADPAGAEPGGARAAGPERPGTGQASGYLRAAVECAEFVLGELRDERGRLLRSYNDGRARIDAFLEDYAFMVEALIALFEASCDQRWLDEAVGLAREMIARFADTEGGGFFSTAADGEELIARRKELEDSPIPSGSSSAALGLLRLAQLTGEQEFELRSDSVLALLAEIAPRHPTAFGHLLQALHWRSEPARPIACELPGPHPSPAPLRGSTGSGPAPSGSPGRGSPPTPGA